jgi:transcriptional regulator with GAF, ATPase, and Fis domain
LFESELFGHEKGAFTGASDRKIGRFEAAGDGTLFLDEVSEIPLDSQVKLLRVLQEKEFERVGGVKSLKADARVLAATNRSLSDCVKQGRFREDLYYRVNVILVTVPLLRDREGDVEILAKFFLDRFNHEAGKKCALTESAWEVLRRHAWPGNVRELQHCLQRAVILAARDALGPEELCLEAVPPVGATPPVVVSLKAVSQQAQNEAEAKAITEMLREVTGKKSDAARRLGVSYKTLLGRIKELKLE